MVRATRRAGGARIVFAAAGTSILAPIAASLLLVALPSLQRGLSVDGLAAGSAVTAFFIVMVIGQPLGGRIGDRFGRGRALRAGTVLLAGASVFGALAPDFQLVFVARLAQAAAGSLAFPNAFALIRNAVPAERRGRVLGALGASIVVAGAAAIPLGQLIVTIGGWRATFVATGALAVFATALHPLRAPAFALDRMPDRAAPTGDRDHATARSGDLTAAVVSLGATNAAMYALLVAIALGAAGRRSPSLILFLLLASSAVGAAAGGRLADHQGRGASAASGLLAMLLGFAMLLRPIATPEWIIVLGALIAGLGGGAGMTGLQTLAADASGAVASGRVAGCLASGRYLGAAVGSFAGSALAIHEFGGENLAMLSAVIAVFIAAGGAARLLWRGSAQAAAITRAPVLAVVPAVAAAPADVQV